MCINCEKAVYHNEKGSVRAIYLTLIMNSAKSWSWSSWLGTIHPEKVSFSCFSRFLSIHYDKQASRRLCIWCQRNVPKSSDSVPMLDSWNETRRKYKTTNRSALCSLWDIVLQLNVPLLPNSIIKMPTTVIVFQAERKPQPLKKYSSIMTLLVFYIKIYMYSIIIILSQS